MNIANEFVLVKETASRWYWSGRNSWSNHLQDAKVVATREEAEKIIGRRLWKGQWGNVKYLTVDEAKAG